MTEQECVDAVNSVLDAVPENITRISFGALANCLKIAGYNEIDVMRIMTTVNGPDWDHEYEETVTRSDEPITT